MQEIILYTLGLTLALGVNGVLTPGWSPFICSSNILQSICSNAIPEPPAVKKFEYKSFDSKFESESIILTLSYADLYTKIIFFLESNWIELNRIESNWIEL